MRFTLNGYSLCDTITLYLFSLQYKISNVLFVYCFYVVVGISFWPTNKRITKSQSLHLRRFKLLKVSSKNGWILMLALTWLKTFQRSIGIFTHIWPMNVLLLAFLGKPLQSMNISTKPDQLPMNSASKRKQLTIPPKEVCLNCGNFLPWFFARPKIFTRQLRWYLKVVCSYIKTEGF